MIEIFDPIHGPIEVCDKAKCIVDTPEFQRLRNIKQLGLCYYVFPGACHNRFEHSLGVYHLTKLYISILGKQWFTEREQLLLPIAGLIHDIGHGPFSHLFDELTNSHHEDRSIQLFNYMNQKYSYEYTDDDISFIKEVIYPTKEHTHKKYLYQIVSNKNGIDVDRFDYIMRDIKMIGLNYGIEWLRIMKGSKIENDKIIYAEKIRTPIENFFLIRYILYKDIYNHHAVRSLEYMIKGILRDLDSKFDLSKCINHNDWERFTMINDTIIDIGLFMDPTNKLIERLRKRQLYPIVQEYIVSDKSDKLNIDYSDPTLYVDTSIITYYGSEMPTYFAGRFTVFNNLTNDSKDTEYHIKVFKK